MEGRRLCVGVACGLSASPLSIGDSCSNTLHNVEGMGLKSGVLYKCCYRRSS